MTSYTNIQIYKSINTQLVLRLSIGILLCMMLVYVYTLISTTVLIAEKRSLESDIQQLHSKISKKEMDYLALSDILDESQLLAYGFYEARNVHFIAKDTTHAKHVAFILEE